MAIDYKTLKNWKIPEIDHPYSAKDSILYALGLNLGHDPVDRDQLQFVYEEGLKALPSLALVLGYPGSWLSETGVDMTKLLHGEQSIRLFKPIPAAGHVVGKSRVVEVIDKGEGKGALVYTERDLMDVASGDLICTQASTSFLRADGGFGGPSGPLKPVHVLPLSAPEAVCDLATLPQQALIYRLSGDYNPLHADPDLAQKAGFSQPILHGMSTFGVVCHALVRSQCGYDPARLRSMALRFSAPVLPGETIRTEMWRDGDIVSFRARVVERDLVVINNGRAEIG